jgi:uncharacterized protein
MTDRPVALVTGASSGLGNTFARVLAEQGYGLVLVARDKRRLDQLAAELPDAEVLVADLTGDPGCATVADRLASTERPVELLVNNAGMGIYDPFGEHDLADEEAMLDLNVRAVLRLTHAAVRAMRARGGGRIVNVSSVASFLPRGIGATYAASKAWVTSFSECLSQQLDGTGVTVTAICPGFVHTEFHQRAGLGRANVPDWMWVDAEDVVRAGLLAAWQGKPISIPDAKWKVMANAARYAPRPVVRRFLRGRSL